MQSSRENPESEANQQATRDNEREVFALQMQYRVLMCIEWGAWAASVGTRCEDCQEGQELE